MSAASARAYYAAHREEILAKRKAARIANPEVFAERDRRSGEKRKARKAETMRAWRLRNMEHRREYRRRYYEENPEKRREEYGRLYAKFSEDYKRRARERTLRLQGVTVERVDRREVYRRDGGRCHLCGGRVPADSFHVDHLVPLSKGGVHSMANVALAHARCNLRRSDGLLPAQLRLLG